MKRIMLSLTIAALSTWGCSSGQGAGDVGRAPDGAIVCLGTGFPDAGVIDPDDPRYSDSIYTEEQVRTMFAEAKAGDTRAYRAFRAARDTADLMLCAFCACGCAEDGHLSATDCFKDIHGFYCGTCQTIALRAEELKAGGLGDDDVKEALLREFPPP